MATPFSSSRTWQHGTFTFTAHSEAKEVDSRGNVASDGQAIAITFKMKPTVNMANVKKGEAADESDPGYTCRVVAVNEDYNNPILPSAIRPGDIGDGFFNGRQCRVTIKNVAQSSIFPITEKVLGSSVTLELNYRVRRGSRS